MMINFNSKAKYSFPFSANHSMKSTFYLFDYKAVSHKYNTFY